jgi:hypothetical protein
MSLSFVKVDFKRTLFFFKRKTCFGVRLEANQVGMTHVGRLVQVHHTTLLLEVGHLTFIYPTSDNIHIKTT